MLIFSHAFSLTLVILNMLKPKQSIYMALQCLNIVAMFLQNVVIIYAVQVFLDFDDAYETLTPEQDNLREWLRIEVYVFIAYIAVSICFLLVRSICRHQI